MDILPKWKRALLRPSRRQYLREYQRKWVAARREGWLRENGPCKHCGSWESLEVDHIDPSTKTHHAIWSWSEERRLNELAKCQVLCSSCHLKKTITQIPKTTDHGRGQMYQAYKCRCDLCRQWKRESDAKYRGSKFGK